MLGKDGIGAERIGARPRARQQGITPLRPHWFWEEFSGAKERVGIKDSQSIGYSIGWIGYRVALRLPEWMMVGPLVLEW